MDGHTLVIEWIGIVLALIFGVTMFCQGHAIFHGKYGYRHTDREKQKIFYARAKLSDDPEAKSVVDTMKQGIIMLGATPDTSIERWSMMM